MTDWVKVELVDDPTRHDITDHIRHLRITHNFERDEFREYIRWTSRVECDFMANRGVDLRWEVLAVTSPDGTVYEYHLTRPFRHDIEFGPRGSHRSIHVEGHALPTRKE